MTTRLAQPDVPAVTPCDDAPLDIGSMRRESQMDEVLERLDEELVGLYGVKTRIRELAAVLAVDRLRAEAGLAAETPSMHMCFTGGPGTGKTTVALRMADILHRLGYLRKGHLVSVSREDLVGQYVGHTAPKTKDVIKRALGGVLFIDEAYYLFRPENERDYGPEAIEVLLTAMEEHRGELVVVLAGYKDRMDAFFRGAPGMYSRVPHHIHFPDYSAAELMQIARLMLRRQMYELSDEAVATFEDYIERRMRQPQFANGRSIRNAIERARLRHANRLLERGGLVTTRELGRIEADDIRKSRVFQGGGAPPPLEEAGVR
ncbi:MAG: AAA family ATPase [Gaiellaceae bacterium]